MGIAFKQLLKAERIEPELVCEKQRHSPRSPSRLRSKWRPDSDSNSEPKPKSLLAARVERRKYVGSYQAELTEPTLMDGH